MTAAPAAKADALILTSTVLLGLGFVLMREGVQVVPPCSYLALRTALAAVVLTLFFVKELRIPSKNCWYPLFVVGTWQGAGALFQTFGLVSVGAGKAGFITGMYLVCVPLVAKIWIGTTPKRHEYLGLALAGAGLCLLVTGVELSLSLGELLLVFGAIAYAVQIVAVTRFRVQDDVIIFSVGQLVLISLLSGMIGIGTESIDLRIPEMKDWIMLLVVSVGSTAFVQLVQMVYQPRTDLYRASLFYSLEAPFALLFGWLIQNESLSVLESLGMVLMFAGGLVTILPELFWNRA